MLARVFIGVGEAAYGSVGLAVVLAVFPVYRRASLTGAFMAGGSFGSVLGVALGGALAVQFGWRWSFAAMAIVGLVLVVLYRLFISDKKLDAHRVDDVAEGEPVSPTGERAKLRTLFSTPSVIAAYVGSGLQLFIAGSLFAWLPSYLGRAYGLAPDKAAGVAAIAILFMGVGMIVCGAVTDRLSRHVPIRKWTTAIVYTAASLVFLGVGFSLPHGRRPAAAARHRRLLRRRHRRPGRRHGRQPDPRVHPGHRAGHPHAWRTTCSASPPDRWSPASWPTSSASSAP